MTTIRIFISAVSLITLSSCMQTQAQTPRPNPTLEKPTVIAADWWKEKYPEMYRPKPKPADPAEQYRDNGTIAFLTFHHVGDTPKSTSLDDEITKIGDSVWKHHVASKFQDVAYHYLVGQSGRIYKGRPDNIAPASGEFYFSASSLANAKYSSNGSTTLKKPDGAKAPGNNQGHITICFLTKNQPLTKEASDAATALAAALIREHKIPLKNVKVHREVADTTCPGNEIHSWLRGSLSSQAYKQKGPGLTAIEMQLLDR